ncbi:MAG TPA: hypothetical protein PLD88_13250, partial [Candidatus Berkiella sp.]|nr:hypothetical protein [Candidatus Berkiella sp.]
MLDFNNDLLLPQQEISLCESFTPQLKTIFDQHKEHKALKSLILCSANFNQASIASLCHCIDSNPLQMLSLFETFLSPQSWIELIEALARHPHLNHLVLVNCLLPDDKAVKIALKTLFSRSKSLENLDLSGHRFSQVTEFENALSRSSTLTHVQGLYGDPLPSNLNSCFEQNMIFAQMKAQLAQWKEERTEEAILDANKILFYKLIKKLQAINSHDKKRLNNMSAEFYLYLANEYQI